MGTMTAALVVLPGLKRWVAGQQRLLGLARANTSVGVSPEICLLLLPLLHRSILHAQHSQVVKEAYPDHTAWDPASPYYDPKR
jgi:hypothetical protein